MTCRFATPSRLRLHLCDRWVVVFDPSRGHLRARLITTAPHWLVCHVNGVRLRRDADGSLSLSAERLLLSVDGGHIEDSAATVAAVDDLLETLQRLLRDETGVSAEVLRISRPAPRARLRVGACAS